MTDVWLYTVGSVFAVSIVSLIGVVTLGMHAVRLRRMVFVLVALSAGALFGDVFIHIVPEALEALPPTFVSLLILSGLLFFFALEKLLRWHHSHETHAHAGPDCPAPVEPVGYLVLVSDGIHNFLDGVIIAASFLVAVPLGAATTIAVILHEIPQEIGDFGVLLHSGFTVSRALVFNLLSALAALLGALVVLVAGEAVLGLADALVVVAAGGFIYIAGSDLVPELQKENGGRSALLQLAGLLAGMGAMFLLLLLE